MDASETILNARRVAVVVAIDVVGYSKLVEQAEETTIGRLTQYWESDLRPQVERGGGRLIKLIGDGALVEFPSVRSALETTVAFGRQLIEKERNVEAGLRIRIRAGLHVGDVIVEADDVYGHGVNIAARLESLATVNSVCLSDAARSVLGRSVPEGLRDLGNKHVKNIEEPIRVWSYDFSGSPGLRPATRVGRRVVYALAGIAAAALAGVAFWQSVGPLGDGVAERAVDSASIIVLPFRNLSDDPRQSFFVNGMTEDLIIDLARLEDLFVVSRNTAFAYRDRNLGDRAIADELGVRYVMQGSVRRDGQRIRVTVAITDGKDGKQLWGGLYDEEVDDVFEVQDRLKRQIVDALKLRLGKGEEAELVKRPTDNLEAYEFFLRGRAARQQSSRRSYRLAYWAFEKAIALEPEFAPALANLAELYATDFGSVDYLMDWERPPTISRVAAERYAERARELAPESAMPEIALARLRLAERKPDQALVHAERSVSLEPQLPESWIVKARIETTLGRHQEALETINEAFRLEPKGTTTQYGVRAMVLFGAGEYLAAVDSILEADNSSKLQLTWQYRAIGLAAAALADRDGKGIRLDEFRFNYGSRLNWGAFELMPIFARSEDQQRFLDGLKKAGVPTLTDPHRKRLATHQIRKLFFGVRSEGYCHTVRSKSTLRISQDGQTFWSWRHDLDLAGTASAGDDRLCMNYPSLSHLGELCFTVFENDLPTEISLGNNYTLDGPLVCYVTPGKS